MNRRSRYEQKQVAILYKSLPHYRVCFYEQLRLRLDQKHIELKLIVGQPDQEMARRHDTAHIQWAERIRNQFFGPKKKLVWQPCLRSLRSADLVVVEQASKLLINYVLLLWQYVGGPKVAFWGHGLNLDVGNASRAGEWIKKRLAKRAYWWFCYTEGTARIVRQLGVKDNRLTVVQNAIDTEAVQRERASMSDEEVSRVRADLGIGDGPIAVSIGSIYDTKRPEYLIQVADEIRRRTLNFEMIVIGDGPLKHIIDEAARTRTWLHPMGVCTGSQMVKFASPASVLLNPGLVGLTVLDAFALGLPMITCNLPFHSPEIEYLEDGLNGLMLPEATSPVGYADRIVQLLTDTESLTKLQSGARSSALKYTLDEMVDRFTRGIVQAISVSEQENV